MPSRYPEPYGLVAMEAARSGIPVILPGTALLAHDMVRHGAGLAVNPRDTAGVAENLAALAQDDDRVRAMSQAAFALPAELGLSTQAWITRLLDFYAARIAAVAVSAAEPPSDQAASAAPAEEQAALRRKARACPSSTAELAAGTRGSRSPSAR